MERVGRIHPALSCCEESEKIEQTSLDTISEVKKCVKVKKKHQNYFHLIQHLSRQFKGKLGRILVHNKILLLGN